MDSLLLTSLLYEVVGKKEFQKGLIDLVFKRAKNKNDAGEYKYIQLYNDVSSVDEAAFYMNKHIISIILPKSIKSISSNSFTGCMNLKFINIPKLEFINYYTFSQCINLLSITLPNTIKTIDTGAFHYCTSIKSIIFPDSLQVIKAYSFWCCENLESITISNNIERIDPSAFTRCTNLKSITIPKRYCYMMNHIFNNCKPITSKKIIYI